MISFAESRCITELDRDRKKGSMMARGAGRGDYSREAIILSISVRGGDYLREAINRGTAIIRGNMVI